MDLVWKPRGGLGACLRRALRGLGLAGALIALGLPRPAAADVAADFAARLEAALASGPVAQDRLWASGARDDSGRMLDARTGAMFDWRPVQVTSLASRPLPPGPNGAERVAVDVLVSGTVTWRANAWGVAQSFWTLQTDERSESDAVVRREEWALEQRGARWLAVDRRSLGVLEIVEAKLAVEVYPGQDAMLVEGSYYLRSLADGVQDVRFLLDRRASVYDFRVNGKLAGVVRGNELGSMGLEGFSPEVESSFAFPAPLKRGEEVLVSFRLRSPLVHMTGKGFVTSLPWKDGPFRERLWLPILGPGDDTGTSRVDLTLRWPPSSFDRVGIAGPPDSIAAQVQPGDEESSLQASWTGRVRDVDFLLVAAGTDVAASGLPIRWTDPAPGQAAHLARTDAPPARVLPALRRERAAVVAPLLQASYASSQDLSSELQDLLPLDDQVLDELLDDSATTAERGADDRAAQ
ncbi:MAG: hypothetical protein U0167_19435 [bacterium]